jgi:hypothetical protein
MKPTQAYSQSVEEAEGEQLHRARRSAVVAGIAEEAPLLRVAVLTGLVKIQ